MVTDFEFDEKLDRRNQWNKKKKNKNYNDDSDFRYKNPYKRKKDNFEIYITDD